MQSDVGPDLFGASHALSVAVPLRLRLRFMGYVNLIPAPAAAGGTQFRSHVSVHSRCDGARILIMTMCLEILFWLGSFVAIYSYLLYPLWLSLVPATAVPTFTSAGLPSVTVIIAARNEKPRIADKLQNTLQLAYPEHLLEILVASDASDDGTDEIAASFAQRNVTVVRSPLRQGKEHAQSLAIAAARGSILVFTDAATRLGAQSLNLIADNFRNPSIGAVSSEDQLLSANGEVRGEGAYVRYEMWLRRLESRAAGLVGLSGSCFAVRREVCRSWRSDTPSDITVALLCARNRLRAVSDGRVIGAYQDLSDESAEFSRKKRTIVRGMTAVWELRESLNPFRYGLFALQVWSHKVFRWLVPIGMALAFSAGALLAPRHAMYRYLFLLQLLLYAFAALAWASRRFRNFMPLRIALYFVLANLATAAALWDFLRGVRIVTWDPSKR